MSLTVNATLLALRSAEEKILSVTPITETQTIRSWSESRRRYTRLFLISAAVGGIELCYAAETAFVSPLLLQLGVPMYLMTLTWMLSPLFGFFLVPVLGSLSDTCGSRLGRRRPFIILYSVGILLGLTLLPYGKNIGQLLGDKPLIVEINNNTNFNSTLSTTQLPLLHHRYAKGKPQHIPGPHGLAVARQNYSSFDSNA